MDWADAMDKVETAALILAACISGLLGLLEARDRLSANEGVDVDAVQMGRRFRVAGQVLPSQGEVGYLGDVGLTHIPLGAWIGLAAWLLTALAYYGIYILTRFPVGWHISRSLGRLLLQLWPIALFLAFLFIGERSETIQVAETGTTGVVSDTIR